MGADIYSKTREHLSSLNASSAGIVPSPTAPDVWGVLMEFRHQGLSTTFVTMSDGSTNLYFSTGGCVIGGGKHALVARAATELLTMAHQIRVRMASVTGMPRPSPDHVRFHLLTFTGNLTAEGLEEDLLHGNHRLAPLFHKVHEVITQLRIASEMQGT